MEVRSLGYRTDLALLRLGGTEVTDRGDHLVVRSPHNPGFWWGNFLLLQGVPDDAAAPAWLERFAAEFPGASHLTLGFDGVDGTVTDLAWFSAHGYSAEAQTVMTARAVHPPRRGDSEATYRRLVSDDDWARGVELRMRCQTAEQDRVAYRAYVTAKAATNRALTEAGHGAWFGAFLDGELRCQMGIFAAGTGLARFQSVETDPEFRRRGLAGSLVLEASRYALAELRAQTLVMVADPDYFAIDLYRSVGFAAAESQLQIERGA